MAAPLELPGEQRIRILTADPNLTPDEANHNADLFLRAGKFAQAMMFLERSRDRERLGRAKDEAVRMGDAFLLHWISRLIPDLVSETEWKDAGVRAMAEGKLLFARECYEKAGDLEKAQKAREEWIKIFPASTVPAPAPPPPPPAPPPPPPPPGPAA
jgi:tetratricopeptide (TPR) repeat protein